MPGIPKGLDAIALRALAKHPGARFADARQMALELEAAAPLASPTRVASWLEGLAHATLAERAKSVAQIESHSSGPYPALREVLRDSMTPTPAPAPLTELQATLVTDPKASLAMAHSSRPSLQVEAASGRRLPGLLYALAAAALVIGSVALGGVIRTRSAAGDAAHAPIPGETSSVVSAAATPSEVRAEGSRPPTAAAVDAASVVAPATAPIPSALAKPPATVRPPPRPKAAAVSPSEGDLGGGHCTIKSFVDESGIEHFTKDCN